MKTLLQIHTAIKYIEHNLNRDFTVDEIAGVTSFSSFHFQRVFKGLVGESYKVFVRKRRLLAAMSKIQSSDISLLEVALENGFQSQEAFTRAFKKEFQLTPGRARVIGYDDKFYRDRPLVTVEYLTNLQLRVSKKPTIQKLPEKYFAGMKCRFRSILCENSNSAEVIPSLWRDFREYRGRQLKVESTATGSMKTLDWGVCFPRNDTVDHVEGDCWYMAAFEIKARDIVQVRSEGKLEIKVVPAGKYAIFTHRGSLRNLDLTMKYIYGSWLATSDQQLREAPDLEMFRENYYPQSEDSQLDLYIPIN